MKGSAKGVFHRIKAIPVMKAMDRLNFGSRKATNSGNMSKPAKSDSFPVKALPNACFKKKSFASSKINPKIK